MGLIQAAMLAGLAAVALPVLLHLTRSRRFRSVEVGTLRFLEARVRERRRWSKIEQWPLLLLRVAAVALLAMVFARPFLERPLPAAGSELEAVVLLDGSGSLASGDGPERVRQAAGRIVAGLPGDALVTVATVADRVKPLESVGEHAAVAGAPTAYRRAVEWALDRLAESDRRFGRVVWVTDGQAAALPGEPPRIWPPGVAASVVVVPPSGDWNVAVADVRLLTPVRGETLELEVGLVFSGAVPRESVDLVVAVEEGGAGPAGREILREQIGTGESVVRLEFPAPEGERLRGWVSIDGGGDAFPIDDRRPFFFHVVDPAPVLLVDGEPGPTPFEGEAYFVDKALRAAGGAAGRSPFRPELRFEPREPERFRAAILCNVREIDAATGAMLEAFVRAGGGLMFFLGDLTEPAAFDPLVEAGWFPATVTAAGSGRTQAIETWDRNHPALEAFDPRRGGNLRRVRLRHEFDLAPAEGARVLASSSAGSPVLVEREVGDGRVLVFAGPADREWNDFPRERLFVPFVTAMARYLANVMPPLAGGRMTTPGLDERREPGIHERSDGTWDLVAPSSLESRVETVDEAAFREALELPDEDALARAEAEASVVGGTIERDRARGDEIWPWLVLALLAILLIENIVADRVRPKGIAAADSSNRATA